MKQSEEALCPDEDVGVGEDMVSCPNCRKENPIGALWCNNCGTSLVGSPETNRQPVTQSPSPHEYKEPPPPPPDSESEVMQVKPLIGVTLVQSPYPQAKQPIESILQTDVACPSCENKMVYTNRYSSYYCKKCKTYPWRCKSCKHTMSSSLSRCPECGAARTEVNPTGVKPMYPACVPAQQPQPIQQQQYQPPAQYQQPATAQQTSPQYQQQPVPPAYQSQTPLGAQPYAYPPLDGGSSIQPPRSPPQMRRQKTGSKKIVAVAIVALLLISSIGIYYYLQNNGTDSGIPAVASPFQTLNLGYRGFSENDRVSVMFYDSKGYSVNVAASSSNPVEVAVPLYLNLETGSFDTANVSMKVIGKGTSIDINKPIRILAPLTTNKPPGAWTTAFIDASVSSLGSATTYLDLVSEQPGLDGVVTPDMRSTIYKDTISLGVINDCIKDISSNVIGEVELGTVNTPQGNVQLNIDKKVLTTCDGIVKSFVDQVIKLEIATNSGIATISSSGEYDPDDPANARQLTFQFLTEVRTAISDKLSTVSGQLGVAAAGIALAAALIGGTAALPLAGAALAVGTASAFMMFTSSVLPAIYGSGLAAASVYFLDKSPSDVNAAKEFRDLGTATVGSGASFGISGYIGEESDVGSALFDLGDSLSLFSDALTKYYKDVTEYKSPAPPVTDPPVNDPPVNDPGYVTCPKCGREYSATFPYCPYCPIGNF